VHEVKFTFIVLCQVKGDDTKVKNEKEKSVKIVKAIS
jgi:hypothetical protein